jgi:microcystin-dependent protein
MADPYLGEIRMFGGNFAPVGWAECDGRLLPIAEYDALFAIIGTIYGGDGVQTFAVPDLRGRAPVHRGAGPGLAPAAIGEQRGAETVTLLPQHLPPHTHAVQVSAAPADHVTPAGGVLGVAAEPVYAAQAEGTLRADAIGTVGQAAPHDNMPPFTTVRFIIAVEGIFPARN